MCSAGLSLTGVDTVAPGLRASTSAATINGGKREIRALFAKKRSPALWGHLRRARRPAARTDGRMWRDSGRGQPAGVLRDVKGPRRAVPIGPAPQMMLISMSADGLLRARPDPDNHPAEVGPLRSALVPQAGRLLAVVVA
jgi:hypothetical protein